MPLIPSRPKVAVQAKGIANMKKAMKAAAAAACMGLIIGVADSFNELLCPPENSIYGQYFRVVYRFVQQHPAEVQEGGAVPVPNAMESALPCSKEP